MTQFLTGARATNWRAFSRYLSPRLAVLTTDLLGNFSSFKLDVDVRADGIEPSNSAMLAITTAANNYIFLVISSNAHVGSLWSSFVAFDFI